MKSAIVRSTMVLVVCASSGSVTRAADVGTAFTYQGRLVKMGTPVTSAPPHCDFTFALWDAATGGNQKGNSPQSLTGVPVTEGLFTVNIDFGPDGVDGTARWLDVTVQCPGDAMPAALIPRQELKPAPYALRAAQGVGPAGTLNVTPTGNVGIGTDTPTEPLDVVGNIHASGEIRSGNGTAALDGPGNRVWSSALLELHVDTDIRAFRIEPVVPNFQCPNIIGGHVANTVTAGVYGATIGGGGATLDTNRVTDYHGTIGGGRNNQAGDNAGSAFDAAYSTVSGGITNKAGGYASTASGGTLNMAIGFASTIGGGEQNVASASPATVCGGGVTVRLSGEGRRSAVVHTTTPAATSRLSTAGTPIQQAALSPQSAAGRATLPPARRPPSSAAVATRPTATRGRSCGQIQRMQTSSLMAQTDFLSGLRAEQPSIPMWV